MLSHESGGGCPVMIASRPLFNGIRTCSDRIDPLHHGPSRGIYVLSGRPRPTLGTWRTKIPISPPLGTHPPRTRTDGTLTDRGVSGVSRKGEKWEETIYTTARHAVCMACEDTLHARLQYYLLSRSNSSPSGVSPTNESFAAVERQAGRMAWPRAYRQRWTRLGK